MMRVKATRRSFVKGGAAGAAGLAVPAYLQAGASPNEKVSLALIGAGGRGGALVGMGGPEVNRVAFCDPDQQYAGKTFERYPKVRRFTDYRKMFDAMEREIDVVAVATPDHHHYPASMMALGRGKHVYCEKPLTYTIEQARRLAKAASDHLVRGHHHTFGLPVITTNCSNNYGPRQFPEKLIPLCIHRALAGEPLPIYGDGRQVRDWLYVSDHCTAIRRVLDAGRLGGGRFRR